MRYQIRNFTRFAVLLLLLLISKASAQTTRPSVNAVISVAMTVEDMERSLDFYTRVLDFQKISDIEVAGGKYEQLFGVFGMRARIVQLRLGEETIELMHYLTPRGRAIPRDSASNDRWFQHIAIVTTDMDRAYMRLRAGNVRHASTGPQTLPQWNPSAGGIRAFYFHDPDDHVLEIIHFPPGKGDPKWQKSTTLFAGIDHTAIVVEDTDRSLVFYRDILGMKIAGSSENYGTEQEHLNNVFGARLRITALRAQQGPGIEFLEYITPRTGRPYPADAKASDLFHWHTTLQTDRLPSLFNTVRQAAHRQISPSPMSIEDFTGALIRDPDGHGIMLIAQ
jgi:catechol 2,3-dioxygenase-like lactoylglutathione lyase family enzyme